jgi:hypothetical protein
MTGHFRSILLVAALSLSSLAVADTLKLSTGEMDFYIDDPLANVDYKLSGNGLSMSMTGAPVTGDFDMHHTIRIVAHDGYAINLFLDADIEHTTTTYDDAGTSVWTVANINSYGKMFATGIPPGVGPLTHTAHDYLNDYYYYPSPEYFSEGYLWLDVRNRFNGDIPGQFSFANFNVQLSVRSVPLPVPEADSYLMMLGGLALLGAVARRRRAAARPLASAT